MLDGLQAEDETEVLVHLDAGRELTWLEAREDAMNARPPIVPCAKTASETPGQLFERICQGQRRRPGAACCNRPHRGRHRQGLKAADHQPQDWLDRPCSAWRCNCARLTSAAR